MKSKTAPCLLAALPWIALCWGQTVASAQTVLATSETQGVTVESVSPMPQPVAMHNHSATCQTCEEKGLFKGVRRWWNHEFKPSMQASHWGYPEEFCERPFGTYTQNYLQAQTWNGLADRLVLYRYDFASAKDVNLNSRGEYQLQKFASAAMSTGIPITLQPSGRSLQLDEARREHVLAVLAQNGIDLPAELVVIQRPWAPGLSGVESELVWQNLSNQTASSGNTLGSGSAGTFNGASAFGSSSGGGSFSGGSSGGSTFGN